MHFFFRRSLLGLGMALCLQGASAQGGFPEFTATEQQWIRANPIVQFSIHEKYRAYWDNGIYPKLLAKLKECSGLDFQANWRQSDEIGIRQIRNGEVSFVIDPNRDFQLANTAYVSDPIFWGQDVMVMTQSHQNRSFPINQNQTIFFNRGYDIFEPAPPKKGMNSPELMIEQLMRGEAQFAVMPLRLAVHLSKQLDLKSLQIRPWGHQPFAYQWLIASKDHVLNSIIQKSLREADPLVMGEILALPALPSNESSALANWLWLGLFISTGLMGLLLLHHFGQRKKQWQKEINLLNMAQEAKNANEAKSTFLATVSHEIRTPMNAVIGAQELLLKNNSLNPKQRELLQSAHASAASLLGMLNQVLDLAKIEAGKFTVEHEPVDLKQILSEIHQTFSIYAQNKGLTLSSLIDPNIADVLLIDPLRIRQILHNLLSNAIKFTEKGVVFFEVRILANDHAGQLLEFRVIDQGIGMNKEEIERVQMPFEQIRNHLSSRGESSSSTGLGLSITNHLIGLMQSKLMIESAPHQGTSIYFVVAVSRTCHPIESERPTSNSFNHSPFDGVKALIVEDHPASRQILFLQLQTLGLLVDQCANGVEALARLDHHSYDVILTDYTMPGMHGMELARKIRSMGHQETLIIGVTADIYAQEKHESMSSSGMDAVLVKPIRLQSLESELRRLFNLRMAKSLDSDDLLSEEMRRFILEEVFRIQIEALEELKDPLNHESLLALIHKIKGGALLSKDEVLYQKCTQLERSDKGIAAVQLGFCESLIESNAGLDRLIQQNTLENPNSH